MVIKLKCVLFFDHAAQSGGQSSESVSVEETVPLKSCFDLALKCSGVDDHCRSVPAEAVYLFYLAQCV